MKIAKTTYEKLGYQDCPRCFPGEVIEATEEEAAAYLNEDSDHAVLLVEKDGFVAVWRGWRGDLHDFFTQVLPLERVEDAKGGDIDAPAALRLAQVLAKFALIEKEADRAREKCDA